MILDAETVPAIDVTAARVVPDRGRGRQARANIGGAVETDDDAGRGWDGSGDRRHLAARDRRGDRIEFALRGQFVLALFRCVFT